MAANICYIAIQGTANPASGTEWNSWVNNTATSTLALDDEDGNSTGWTMILDVAASGSDADGVNSAGSGDAAWVNEATVSARQLYNLSETVASEFRFTGLDNSATYDFEVFGSKNTTGRLSEFSFDDSTYYTYATDNNSTLTTTQSASPSGGAITLYWRSNTSVGYLNAIRIEEIAGTSAVPIFSHHYTKNIG